MAKYPTLLVSLAFLLGTAHGQQITPDPVQTLKSPKDHKFWDTHNKIFVPSYLALTAGDAYLTEQH